MGKGKKLNRINLENTANVRKQSPEMLYKKALLKNFGILKKKYCAALVNEFSRIQVLAIFGKHSLPMR